METGQVELDARLLLSLRIVDCVSLVVLLRVVCLLQLVSQSVSPACHWEARSPTQNGTEMIWMMLIWRGKGRHNKLNN